MINRKKIESPEKMWDLFEQYKVHTKSNPYIVKDWVGKDGNQIEREKERPLTMVGFEAYVLQDLHHYFSNYKDDGSNYDEFVDICSIIRKVISAEQIEGGMANVYNHSITARLNGLVEKQEIKATLEQPLFPDVSENNGSK